MLVCSRSRVSPPSLREKQVPAAELLGGAPETQALALATRSLAALRAGDVADATAAAERGWALLESCGGRTEEGEATIRLARAEALAAAGRARDARAAIVSAADRLLERAATSEDPDQRKSFLGRVRDHARTLQLRRLLEATPEPGGTTA
jgi:eukaryotic-like serine/threonine-protein kinase